MSGERQQVSEVSETDKDYKLNQISQELKDKMIDEIRNGVDYKHFTVKEFKNGKAQLIRKKANVQTKDGKESKKNTKQDDDPILDHFAKIHKTIGVLESQMKTKNKKRKRQIEEIYSLFGGLDSENEEEPTTKPVKKKQIVIEDEDEPVNEHVTKKERTGSTAACRTSSAVIEDEPKPVKKDLKTSLRSRLKYLS